MFFFRVVQGWSYTLQESGPPGSSFPTPVLEGPLALSALLRWSSALPLLSAKLLSQCLDGAPIYNHQMACFLVLFCFFGVQFPSPFPLTINYHYIQLCLLYLVNSSTYKPRFLCLWLLVYCLLLCVFCCSVFALMWIALFVFQ